MAWRIEGEPEKWLFPERRNGMMFVWRIVRRAEPRNVEVFLTSDVLEFVEGLPADLAVAVQTRGRSVVESLLTMDDPPQRMLVATDGITVEVDVTSRLREIREWFDDRGFDLVTDMSGDRWVCAVLRKDVRVGVGDVAGEGATPLEAAEAALAKYEGREDGRDAQIVGVPAEATAEGVPGTVYVDEDTVVGVGLPFSEEATERAVDYGWRLGFIDEPDGSVLGVMMAWEDGEVLKTSRGRDFQDAYLGLGADTQPPSEEARTSPRGDASDPRADAGD